MKNKENFRLLIKIGIALIVSGVIFMAGIIPVVREIFAFAKFGELLFSSGLIFTVGIIKLRYHVFIRNKEELIKLRILFLTGAVLLIWLAIIVFFRSLDFGIVGAVLMGILVPTCIDMFFTDELESEIEE